MPVFFIMLIEYVEGVELNDMPIIPENVKAEIKASMEKIACLKYAIGRPSPGVTLSLVKMVSG